MEYNIANIEKRTEFIDKCTGRCADLDVEFEVLHSLKLKPKTYLIHILPENTDTNPLFKVVGTVYKSDELYSYVSMYNLFAKIPKTEHSRVYISLCTKRQKRRRL